MRFPKWDSVSQKKVRDALLLLASILPDTNRMYGTEDDVDPVRFVIGAATGGGRIRRRKHFTSTFFPPGITGPRFTSYTSEMWQSTDFGWSAFYNAEGYFQQYQYNAYSLNNITAKKNADPLSPLPRTKIDFSC